MALQLHADASFWQRFIWKREPHTVSEADVCASQRPWVLSAFLFHSLHALHQHHRPLGPTTASGNSHSNPYEASAYLTLPGGSEVVTTTNTSDTHNNEHKTSHASQSVPIQIRPLPFNRQRCGVNRCVRDYILITLDVITPSIPANTATTVLHARLTRRYRVSYCHTHAAQHSNTLGILEEDRRLPARSLT
jgi:hypothetical protein